MLQGEGGIKKKKKTREVKKLETFKLYVIQVGIIINNSQEHVTIFPSRSVAEYLIIILFTRVFRGFSVFLSPF